MTTCRNIKHDEQRRRSALQRAAAAEASASAAERLERDGVLAFLRDKGDGLKIDPPLSLFG
jgi:hypothetical protein